jgi:voltage-gated potassium channel Kch
MEDACINLWVRLFKEFGFVESSAKSRMGLSARWLKLFFSSNPILIGDRTQFEGMHLASIDRSSLSLVLLPIQKL